jgi:hypothetical protein
MKNGIVEINGVLYYYENGTGVEKGLFCLNGDYYFSQYKGKLVTNENYYAYLTSCDLPKGKYEFGADGKMLQGIVEKSDGYYYYVNGKINWTNAGLRKIGDYYYNVTSTGKCTTGTYYCWESHCDLPVGTYEFGADGRMLDGIVEKSDGYYYYVMGKIYWTEAGLHKIGDDYYNVNSAGKCTTGKYYCWATHCDLPVGEYEFGEDGKMLQGLVDKGDDYYYYVNGNIDWTEAGLHKIGDYYYNINSTSIFNMYLL